MIACGSIAYPLSLAWELLWYYAEPQAMSARVPATQLQRWRLALAVAIAVGCFGLALAGCGDDGAGDEGAGGQVAAEGSAGAAPARERGPGATGRERARIVAAFDAYMSALAAGDYEAACRRLISQVRAQLERTGSEQGGGGCSRALSAFRDLARSSAGREIEQVRVDGDVARVIYRAPGAEPYQARLRREDGEWKAGLFLLPLRPPSS